MRTEAEVYRFTWRSSFDGDAVVRWGGSVARSRSDASIALPWSGTPIAVRVLLTMSDWTVAGRVDRPRLFGRSIRRRLRLGLDGSDWLIVGRRKDIYHAISRWSPDGAIYDLGKLFLELADPPLAEVEIY
jgi:hypothetical protein